MADYAFHPDAPHHEHWALTGMRKFRPLLSVTLLVRVLPIAAYGQWARGRVEHDWRFAVGGYSFGLVQRATDTTGQDWGWCRTTTICLGPYTITTHFRAAYVAMVPLLPIGAGGVLLMTRLRRQGVQAMTL
jgi:hypothetical protein